MKYAADSDVKFNGEITYVNLRQPRKEVATAIFARPVLPGRSYKSFSKLNPTVNMITRLEFRENALRTGRMKMRRNHFSMVFGLLNVIRWREGELYRLGVPNRVQQIPIIPEC